MKKLFALVLALIMVMGMATTAFAAETGSITISGAHAEYTYEIYKILDLESYDKTNGTYSYKVNAKWSAFFETAATAYFEVSDDGYVSLKEGNTLAADVAAFAQNALAYAQANNIDPEKTTKNADDATQVNDNAGNYVGIKFSGLDLGYYLIDSDLGVLCGLTTTNPEAVVNAKNTPPTQDKQVQEDGTGNWGSTNVAGIGETVNFRITVQVHSGAQNYVIHDSMSAGLTFDPDSVVVYHIEPGDAANPSTTTPVAATNYTVDKDPVVHTDTCTGTCDNHGACTFEVVFDNDFCKTLATNDKLIILYSATVNENAVIAGEGNPNDSRLSFGEGYCTGWDTTITYTYGFDIVKTDGQYNLIDGAKFKVYESATGTTPVDLVKIEDDLYRRATAEDDVADIVTEIDVKNGLVKVVGFDNGTYYLEETQAPAGYNKLTSRIAFTISDANLSAMFINEIYTTGTGVHVVNESGTMLPETGGMGTTMFYVFGGLMVAVAVVLLVTKKRMVAEN